ncbi:MAG: MBL fold metallo-hydrolase [Saprospirales bacterium]|nr:MBL fold metallo-hydrolase [Saprospirales bacterium]MBK8489396.1 MBL fold metallo-hydrolase [Saprospirales bacterium]
MRAVFLGTGTSQGVPVIGCDCAVCRSQDPNDQRLRTALLVECGATRIAIDAGPDFRQQMLREGVQTLDAVLLTHEHNDHIIGLDDVRPFNFRQHKNMPILALPRVLDSVRSRFAYVFDANPYPGAPRLELLPLQPFQSFQIGELSILPFLVGHGGMEVLGFRFGSFTYITDMKTLPAESREAIKGTEVLVVNALHHKPHYSHLNLEEALEFIRQVNPREAYLTHISHHMGKYADISPQLPSGVFLASDGQKLKVNT